MEMDFYNFINKKAVALSKIHTRYSSFHILNYYICCIFLSATAHLLNPLAKFAVLVYNQFRSRKIWHIRRLYNRKLIKRKHYGLQGYPLFPVEDSLVRYLQLSLLSKYGNAVKITSSSVSISSVFILTSFPFPERTIADYPYLL